MNISKGVKLKNLDTGHLGEQIAKIYLQNKGHHIVEENYKTKYAEIDLVTHSKGVLVFVEVRTRRDERFGSPEDSINRSKIRKLTKNAQAYVARKRYAKTYRIDAICIVLDDGGKASRITHYKNITF